MNTNICSDVFLCVRISMLNIVMTSNKTTFSLFIILCYCPFLALFNYWECCFIVDGHEIKISFIKAIRGNSHKTK